MRRARMRLQPVMTSGAAKAQVGILHLTTRLSHRIKRRIKTQGTLTNQAGIQHLTTRNCLHPLTTLGAAKAQAGILQLTTRLCHRRRRKTKTTGTVPTQVMKNPQMSRRCCNRRAQTKMMPKPAMTHRAATAQVFLLKNIRTTAMSSQPVSHEVLVPQESSTIKMPVLNIIPTKNQLPMHAVSRANIVLMRKQPGKTLPSLMVPQLTALPCTPMLAIRMPSLTSGTLRTSAAVPPKLMRPRPRLPVHIVPWNTRWRR
mmetsp:Transcript_48780/g.97055  ORF Transcript_48780/g.97055 Transcript_48780/m.97055 type:complete len:257 (-) Transcript_48780:123-893(-)